MRGIRSIVVGLAVAACLGVTSAGAVEPMEVCTDPFMAAGQPDPDSWGLAVEWCSEHCESDASAAIAAGTVELIQETLAGFAVALWDANEMDSKLMPSLVLAQIDTLVTVMSSYEYIVWLIALEYNKRCR